MTNEQRERMDKENHATLQRIDTQLTLDGKLRKSYQMDVLAYLALPVIFGTVIFIANVLGAIGVPEKIILVINFLAICAILLGGAALATNLELKGKRE